MMKKLQSHNIIFIILYVVQVVITGLVTLFVLLFKPIDEGYVIIFDIMAAVGFVIVLFAPYIAFWIRKLFGIFYIYDPDKIDQFDPNEEPGPALIAGVKFVGYFLLCFQLALLFM